MTAVESSEAISNFVVSARAYCAIIEGAAGTAPYQLAEQSVIALADLYSHALRLPEVEPCEESPLIHRVELPPMVQPALARLGASPSEDRAEDESVWDALNSVLLTDDFADIYSELKGALALYDSGDDCTKANAVWEWKFSFETHWREHLVHALYVLDRMLRENTLPEEP
jgi:hypothetical protein